MELNQIIQLDVFCFSLNDKPFVPGKVGSSKDQGNDNGEGPDDGHTDKPGIIPATLLDEHAQRAVVRGMKEHSQEYSTARVVEHPGHQD